MDRTLHANAGDMVSVSAQGRFHMPWSNLAQAPQLLNLHALEPVLGNKRSHHNEKPTHYTKECPLQATTRESP